MHVCFCMYSVIVFLHCDATQGLLFLWQFSSAKVLPLPFCWCFFPPASFAAGVFWDSIFADLWCFSCIFFTFLFFFYRCLGCFGIRWLFCWAWPSTFWCWLLGTPEPQQTASPRTPPSFHPWCLSKAVLEIITPTCQNLICRTAQSWSRWSNY